MADEDLLRPTLADVVEAPSLYSSSAFFMASFFAGPAAAGVYGLANSYRLGRWRRDLPVILAAVAASYWLLLFVNGRGGLGALADLLEDRPARALQLAIRILGLACFAAIYLLHRQHYRAARISGVEPLSGWVPGIAAFVIGIGANIALASMIKGHH